MAPQHGGEGLVPRTGATGFPELVVAHHCWLVASWPYRWPPDVLPAHTLTGWTKDGRAADAERVKELRMTYCKKLREFEALEGKIIRAYWCFRAPSGVVLTEKEPERRGARRLVRAEPGIHIHRASDWLTMGVPAITQLLHHSDALAVRASLVLRGTARRIALESIFEQQSYLLGLVERRLSAAEERDGEVKSAALDGDRGRRLLRPRRKNATPAAPQLSSAATKPLVAASSEDPLIKAAKDDLVRIERYYDRAATRTGNVIYFLGMALGAIIVALVALGTALLAHADVVAAFAAGAIGAVVSVMVRMGTGNFRADYEVGRDKLLLLGFVRPCIGAIFGLAVYFALLGDLVQITPRGDGGANVYFYAFLAFLAGFSERWTHIILGGAQRTIESALGGPEDKTHRTEDAGRAAGGRSRQEAAAPAAAARDSR